MNRQEFIRHQMTASGRRQPTAKARFGFILTGRTTIHLSVTLEQQPKILVIPVAQAGH